MNFDLRGFHG